jgi:hypothetical protein
MAQFRTHDLTKELAYVSTQQAGQLYTLILNCFSVHLPLPNEDFGRLDKHFRVRFRSTFQGCEYSIWATQR